MSVDEDELFTNVLSKKELEAMIDDGKEDEGLFEKVGKAADAVGETKWGQKIGAILGVLMLALISGGANLTILDDYFNGDDGPVGGCLQVDATNYNPDATFDDGSCNFLVIIYGCTNSEAENYNSQATHDDGRCVVINNIPNGTNGNETAAIYGCMDTTANNYDDKATEDDGSCDYEDEYEEEHGNHTTVHFYPGWYNEETDNMTVFWVDPDAEGISVLVDIDTDCYDYNTSVLLYVDVWNHVPEDTEGEQQYAWKDLTMTVDGMAWDEHWLNFTFEELNNTNGTWSMWVALLVWDTELEDYVYQQQFDIPMIRVEAAA